MTSVGADLIDDLAGRRIVITGHRGFLGAWTSLVLESMGAHVVGLGRTAEPSPLQRELGLETMDVLTADIGDADAVHHALHPLRPDAVTHLAAQSVVGRASSAPQSAFEVNVMGTVHVVDAAVNAGADVVTLAGTDRAYRDRGRIGGLTEDAELGGTDPYSASKAAAEVAMDAYRGPWSAAGARPVVVSLRTGNLVGGGDRGLRRLVPEIIAALAAGRTPTLRTPDAVASWLGVWDAAWAHALVIARALADLPVAPAYNLVHPDGLCRVADVAEWSARAWAGDTDLEWAGARAAPDVMPLIDGALARTQLRWSPSTSITRTFAETVAYERCNPRNRSDLARRLVIACATAQRATSAHHDESSED